MSTLTRPAPRAVSPAHRARLRLLTDDGLLRLVRGGDERAFDTLVRRYDAPLLAFCRHILGSREDAEDVMQETWSAAYRAMLRDDRQLTIRAWLYAIARNTCLNAMRTSGPRPTLVPVGVSDESAEGILHRLPTAHSAADHLADRERFRVLIGDIQELPENQRTALVLHELDALTYDEIAGVLDVSVGAVKSLLVRARVGLTESAEARELDCDVVRLELAAAAQRVAKLRAASRAHVRNCDDCASFNTQLKKTSRSLSAAISPLPLIVVWLQKIGLGKLAGGGGIAAGSAAGGSSLVGAGGSAFALKAAATVAAAALATAGAGEVHRLTTTPAHKGAPAATSAASVTPIAVKPAPAVTVDKTTSTSDSTKKATTTNSVIAESIPRTTKPGPVHEAAAPLQKRSSQPVDVQAQKSTPSDARPQVQQTSSSDDARPTVTLADPPATLAPGTDAAAATDGAGAQANAPTP